MSKSLLPLAAPAPASLVPQRNAGWGQAAPADPGNLPFSYFLVGIRRNRSWIIAFVLAVTVVTTLVELVIPKKYDAEAILRVEPEATHVVGDNQSSSSPVDATLLVTTESEVILSPAVVLETIDALDLGDKPEFALPPARAGSESPSQHNNRLIREIGDRITVDQPAETFLLGVHFRSRDPQLAADVANGLASAFLEHEYSTRAKALAESSHYMTDQLDGLRAQMERDQTALVNYESSHDVIDPNNKDNIYYARLTQINQDLGEAQSLRLKLEADDQSTQSQDIDALMVTDRGQSLVALHARYLADERDLDRMASTYGPEHPLYQQQTAVVAQDQRALAEEAEHIRDQVHSQYAAALDRENLIQASLNREKLAMDAFNLRAVRFQALQASADSSNKLFYDLQQRIQDSNVASGLRSEDLRVISPALPPDKPASPRPLLAGLLAALGSSLLAMGGATILTLRDRTLSSAEQIESRFGLAAISSLPNVAGGDLNGLGFDQYRPDRAPGGERAEKPSLYQEAVLSLHTAMHFLSDAPMPVLAVTSSIPGEGKSTVCCHLAAAYALMGARVVLVDADMRKPNVHRLFHLSNQIGLSSVLSGKCEVVNATVPSGMPHLTIVPAGPHTSGPSELLHTGLEQVLERLQQLYDVVMVDCPPAIGFSDAATVASLASGVLVVVHAGKTDQAQVAGALRSLRGVRANILGIVLNRVSKELNGSSYYDGYASYYSDDDESATE